MRNSSTMALGLNVAKRRKSKDMEFKSTKLSSQWCYISDLHPTKMKENPAIKLRFVRVYELPHFQNKNKIVSLECIAHDSKGERIAITIPRTFIDKWKNVVKEGVLYGIRNFIVIHNSGFKIVKHDYRIKFDKATNVRRMVEDAFPKQIFAFKEFEEIQIMDVTNEFFDVIGILLNKPYIQNITTRSGVENKLLELNLQDPEGKRMSCTLWDNYAVEFLKSLEKNGQPSNVIILHYGKPYMYQGVMKMQSYYYVSKVMVNAELKEVEDFRKRVVAVSDLSTTIIGSQSEGSASCLTNNKTNAIGELKTIEKLFFVNEVGFYWILGEVLEIDSDEGWYYIACKSCKTKMIKREHHFYCENCKMKDTTGNLRYRIIIDVGDETGGTRLVLWDRECNQIVGKCVADLIENMDYMSNLPDIVLKAFMGIKFLFKIALKQDADNNYNGSYSVMEVNSDLTYITAFNRNTSMLEVWPL